MQHIISEAKKRADIEIESHNYKTEYSADDRLYTAIYKIRFKNGLKLESKAQASERQRAIDIATKIARSSAVNIFIYIEYESDRIKQKRLDEAPLWGCF